MSDENDASSKCECKVLLVTASVIYLLFISIVHNKHLEQLKCRLECHCSRSHRRRRFFWILYLKAFMPIKWAAIKSAIVWVGSFIFKCFFVLSVIFFSIQNAHPGNGCDNALSKYNLTMFVFIYFLSLSLKLNICHFWLGLV